MREYYDRWDDWSGRLSPQGRMKELVRRTLSAEADEDFCVACHETTTGNPLFLRELLRVLASNGIRPVSTRWIITPNA